jgi:hypothetical protein
MAALGVILTQQRIVWMPQIHYPLSLDNTPSLDDFNESDRNSACNSLDFGELAPALKRLPYSSLPLPPVHPVFANGRLLCKHHHKFTN